MDKMFRDTNIVLLVLFGLCCGIIAFVLGLVGVFTCQDPIAKRNATIVTVISGALMAIGLVLNFAGLLSGLAGR